MSNTVIFLSIIHRIKMSIINNPKLKNLKNSDTKTKEVDKYLLEYPNSTVNFNQFIRKFSPIKASVIARQLLEKYDVIILNCKEIDDQPKTNIQRNFFRKS